MEYNAPVQRAIPNATACSRARWLRAAGFGLALTLFGGCSPQAALVTSLLPDGTVSVLLSHLEREEQGNRKRIAELETRKDWDGLAKFAEENLTRDPHSADWWFVAGYAHAQAGRQQRAIECYGEMVRLAPDDLLGWSLLAQSYRDSRQPLRAVQTLNNAHLVHKGTASTYFLLGESYAELDRDLPAAAAYREAVQLNGEFAQAWFGLGRASSRLGRKDEYEKALKALERLDSGLARKLAALRPRSR